jgi:hypothetical protein
MADPMSTVDTLRDSGNAIDRGVDAAMSTKPYTPPATTGAPIARDPPQPIQAKVNPDNDLPRPGLFDRVKSVFTGENPYIK